MMITIKGTNLDLSEALKEYVEEKVGDLERLYERIITARVELERMPHHHKGGVFRCEVNLDVPQKGLLRAESVEPDLYAAIDMVIPKLKEQIDTYKAKKQHRDKKIGRWLKTMFPWRRG